MKLIMIHGHQDLLNKGKDLSIMNSIVTILLSTPERGCNITDYKSLVLRKSYCAYLVHTDILGRFREHVSVVTLGSITNESLLPRGIHRPNF